MIAIRKFKPDDMFSVINIAFLSLPERYNPAIFNQFYEAFPDGFLVAESHHKIVGFLIGALIPGNTAKILMIAVTEPHRRHGIGSLLLEQFTTDIKKRSIRTIHLETRINNTPAIRFYKKHGFRIMEKIEKFYQNGHDGILLQKQL